MQRRSTRRSTKKPDATNDFITQLLLLVEKSIGVNDNDETKSHRESGDAQMIEESKDVTHNQRHQQDIDPKEEVLS